MKALENLQIIQLTVIIPMIMLPMEGHRNHCLPEPHSSPLGGCHLSHYEAVLGGDGDLLKIWGLLGPTEPTAKLRSPLRQVRPALSLP